MGRPSGLTPSVQKIVVNALKAGSFIDAACELAGISDVTFYAWVKLGKREKVGPHAEFLRAVKGALAAAEVELVGTIRAASKQQWQAAAWILERRFPSKWAKSSEKPKAGETKSEGQPAAKIVWVPDDPPVSEPEK